MARHDLVTVGRSLNENERPRSASSTMLMGSTPTLGSPKQPSLQSLSSSFQHHRPNSIGKDIRDLRVYPNMDPGSTLGQFAYAPATQTTVVTTTTTTTTKFPPIVMRHPRRLRNLDPKLYPLAMASTPASLRNIRFELGGRPAMFCEAEDTSFAIKKVSPIIVAS